MYVDKLKDFAQFHGNTKLLISSLMNASYVLNDMSLNKKKRQTIMDLFF